ncbi:MAG: diguanylate cyclase [Ruthenibacterium sp.]
MREQDVEILLAQIQNIILNKPISGIAKTESEELADLQDAISYLADSLSEANEFLKNLSMGNLDAKTPSRHNFLAASLKELHAGLRSITWQAEQVANGDYGQKVNFLGEFSDSFNKMAAQLAEREAALREQTDALTHSMNLLIAIMDGMDSWVLVAEKDTNQVLYTNQSAHERFYDAGTGLYICGEYNCLLHKNLLARPSADYEQPFEFHCPRNDKTLRVKAFAIHWNGKMAYVYFIADITGERAQTNKLESMAFKDELTGLYNRRYGIQQLTALLSSGQPFAVCLIDLDQLKCVNDELGHTIGDEYITTVTHEMTRLCCDECSLFRVGGDEFVALRQDGTEEIMRKMVSKLEKRIAAIPRNYTMAISCGILAVPAGSDLTVENVMTRVDEKMYVVKNEKKKRRNAAAGT